jgi:glycosyltransferase involved in cell wall biosynthesis
MKSRIHSILLVKNEEDIIEACLKSACNWSDFIYVYDGSSDDRTWEIVSSLRSEKIIPFRQHDEAFKEGLRADAFNAYRGNAEEGDWWCRLDADEFYVDDPKEFLSRTKAWNNVVWGASIQYYLTHEDVSTLDFSAPTEQLLRSIRYYNANSAEPRFFRHRRRLLWDNKWAWPRHLGVAAEQFIRFRHYKYRSPAQIQSRLDVRREARRRGFEGWGHAKELNWQEKIVCSNGLELDNQDGCYVIDYAKLPDHRGSFSRRSLQHAFHTLGLWP